MPAAQKNRGNVTELAFAPKETPVSDELQRLTTVLLGICPSDATVHFSFNGRLSVEIDVRTLEQVMLVEAELAKMPIFHDIRRGAAPHRSFFRRVSALVDR